MKKQWTKEQVKDFLKEHNVTDGSSLEDAFASHFKGLIQAILEEEMDNELGIPNMIGRIRKLPTQEMDIRRRL